MHKTRLKIKRRRRKGGGSRITHEHSKNSEAMNSKKTKKCSKQSIRGKRSLELIKKQAKKKSKEAKVKGKKIKEAQKEIVCAQKKVESSKKILCKAKEKLKTLKQKYSSRTPSSSRIKSSKNASSSNTSDALSSRNLFNGGSTTSEFFSPNPTNRRQFQAVIAERYDPSKDDGSIQFYSKTVEQRKKLQKAVTNIFVFRNLDQIQTQSIIDAMFELPVTKGQVVIQQGDEGDFFYIIEKGTFSVYVKNEEKQSKVETFKNEGSFGELALIYNAPRSASVVAETDGMLWALDRQTFKRIVANDAFNKQAEYMKLLLNVPMLRNLNEYERTKLCDALESKVFQDGELIIKQNDPAEGMYFIEHGDVRVVAYDKSSKEERELTELKYGDYFGELALLTNKPRAASVYAIGDVKVAFLDVASFERLLGPCMDVMKRVIVEYEQQMLETFGPDDEQNS